MFGLNPLSGVTSSIKMAAAAAVVLALVGAWAVQRSDAITAATAEQEIDDLLEVIEHNKQHREAAEELAEQEREAKKEHQDRRKQAETRVAEQTAFIEALPKETPSPECKICPLDSLLPELPSSAQ